MYSHPYIVHSQTHKGQLLLNSVYSSDDDEELDNTVGKLGPEDTPEDLDKDMWAPESDQSEASTPLVHYTHLSQCTCSHKHKLMFQCNRRKPLSLMLKEALRKMKKLPLWPRKVLFVLYMKLTCFLIKSHTKLF